MQTVRLLSKARPGAFWAGFAAGAFVMFLADPTADAGRRARVRGHARHVLAHSVRRLARTARFTWSQGQGATKRAVHRHPAPPADDLALLDRIESEIYNNPSVPKGAFNVEVVNGEVVVRGQLADAAAIETVVSSIKAVAGVGPVKSWLHVAGTPAPNKEDALAASGATP